MAETGVSCYAYEKTSTRHVFLVRRVQHISIPCSPTGQQGGQKLLFLKKVVPRAGKLGKTARAGDVEEAERAKGRD